MLSKKQVATAVGLALTTVVLGKVGGCSSGPKSKSEAPPATAAVTCGELQFGEAKEESCANGTAGSKTLVCTEKGLQVAVDRCGGNGGNGNGDGNGGNTGGNGDCGVTFAEVKPILTTSCVSCHASPTRIDEFGTARAWAQKIVTRVNLTDQDNRRMPLLPKPALSAADKEILKAWVDNKTLEHCASTTNSGSAAARRHINFSDIERAVKVDLADNVDASNRDETIYLSTVNRFDGGADLADLATYRKAMDKTLNSVNPRGSDLSRPVPVAGTNETVWRVYLDDYEIDSAKLKVLTDNDKLPINSLTDDGAIIKALSGRNQTIFSVDNFIQLAMSAPVYHAMTETPATLDQYLQNIGINFADDLNQLDDVAFVGATTSPITNLKNRLFVRDTNFKAGTGRARGAYFYQTFDTLPVANNIADRNLFNFPLLKGVQNSVKNFRFDASETIASAPNGLQLYGLWDAQGKRLDVALNSIVRDTSSPSDVNIRNGNSCSRCHNAGVIPMVDQIRDHVTRNASQFTATDVRLVQAVYRPAVTNTKNIADDQGSFAKALAALDINPAESDPQSQVFDRFLLDWDLKAVCGYLFLELEQCKVLLDQSPTARAEIGQVLTGGVVTFENFKDVYLKLVDEMQLFRDEL